MIEQRERLRWARRPYAHGPQSLLHARPRGARARGDPRPHTTKPDTRRYNTYSYARGFYQPHAHQCAALLLPGRMEPGSLAGSTLHTAPKEAPPLPQDPTFSGAAQIDNPTCT